MNLRRQLMIDYYVGGILHVLLKPFVIALGKILRRDHDLSGCSDVTIVKLLGGGSLVIAYPALLEIKRRPSVRCFRILTSPAVKPFAESLRIFDEIQVIRTSSVNAILLDSLSAIRRLFRCHTIIDLEVHSRLTTVLALLTCARNRIGFYTRDSFWRRYLSTHLIFCNTGSGVYHFYDQIAALFRAPVKPFSVYQEAFRQSIGDPSPPRDGILRMSIAPCSSDLGKERMLRHEEWIDILRGRRDGAPGQHFEILLFGAAGDRPELDKLAALIEQRVACVSVNNRAGRTNLMESVLEIAETDELLCIDSSLLHYGRLMKMPTSSYWGPTDPESRLRPWECGKDQIHYTRLPCSPCVHLAGEAPCQGNNLCMRLAVHPKSIGNRNPCWIVKDERVIRFTRESAP